MFSSEEKGKEEADSAARAAGVEPSELHIEACAICCDDIILGPHSAVLKMKIPEARAATSEGEREGGQTGSCGGGDGGGGVRVACPGAASRWPDSPGYPPTTTTTTLTSPLSFPLPPPPTFTLNLHPTGRAACPLCVRPRAAQGLLRHLRLHRRLVHALH